MDNTVAVGIDIRCGAGEPLLLIAGPCVLETDDVNDAIAGECQAVCQELGINYVFKASFDKANRSSIYSNRGPGIEHGRRQFDKIRQKHAIPVVTDIHEPYQALSLAASVDMLQIPALLSRQTDLLEAASLSELPVLVKKSQTANPSMMKDVLDKLEYFGCHQAIFCERGTAFGYGQLVNDMTSLAVMRELGVPVAFDATHSVQVGGVGWSGGRPEMIAPLVRAATAVGIDALFLETHPLPAEASSDGACMLPLAHLRPLLESVVKIREALA
jgi:2-dehydro-3-deoxyphosphooctonate aldolase (KDO 8-P synthase)